MTDDHLNPLGIALHERVRDEHPDLDRLISVSTRTGARIRRRRTALATIGGTLGVAAVVGIVGSSLGGGSGTPGAGPDVATQPAASSSTSPSTSPSPSTRADELEGLRPQDLPVRVAPSLRGWQIGLAADDKFPASKGDAVVSVNVRPRSELAAWSGDDPDRPASQVVHRGENYFVTVQAGPDVPNAVVAELVDALRYQPRWKR